jgi:hypothetical protein
MFGPSFKHEETAPGPCTAQELFTERLIFIGVHLVHSQRRQTAGSTRVARSDGTYAAASPTAIRIAITPHSVTGSYPDTPQTWLAEPGRVYIVATE